MSDRPRVMVLGPTVQLVPSVETTSILVAVPPTRSVSPLAWAALNRDSACGHGSRGCQVSSGCAAQAERAEMHPRSANDRPNATPGSGADHESSGDCLACAGGREVARA